MSNPNQVVVSQVSDVTTVEITTQGPQGPSFAASGVTLLDASKVDKSIIYYDGTAGSYKADSTWTTSTITDGGNF